MDQLSSLANAFYIVCRQHARAAGPLHGTVHPAVVDGLCVLDDVALPEGNLISVPCRVVIQSSVHTLFRRREQSTSHNINYIVDVILTILPDLCQTSSLETNGIKSMNCLQRKHPAIGNHKDVFKCSRNVCERYFMFSSSRSKYSLKRF